MTGPVAPPTIEAPVDDKLDLAGVPIKGSKDTAWVLIEFSDYQCPFCIRHHQGVAMDLEREFVETGKLRVAFMNNPLPMHEHANILATAAICAGMQGDYWTIHDWLFIAQPRGTEAILGHARKLHLDTDEFKGCVDSNPDPQVRINDEIRIAQRLGLLGTPSFAIGETDPQGVARIRKYIRGAQPMKIFRQVINEVLGESLR